MRGTIVKTRRGDAYLHILGENGEEFFSLQRLNPEIPKKVWDKYCYNGNHVDFKISDEQSNGKHRIAYNVVFDEVDDPDKAIKKQRSYEARENRKRNLEMAPIKAERRRIQERNEERNRLLKEYYKTHEKKKTVIVVGKMREMK